MTWLLPQEKALVIRVSRITFAFRNKVWPKPMEGLDLFNPVNRLLAEENSPSPTPTPLSSWEDEEEEDGMESMMCEESEESEGNYELDLDDEDDEDYSEPSIKLQKKTDLTLRIGKTRNGGELMITTRDSNRSLTSSSSSTPASSKGGTPFPTPSSFQVEKQQGLKLTFRKSGRQTATARNEGPAPTQVIDTCVGNKYICTLQPVDNASAYKIQYYCFEYHK